ncbi:MAG TPA: TIGR00645 family protein [Gordonia sp. (in: high G+C Gram-positive bacteria)]|uniref:TIGR00645 family protein n=2 Tax=unclassified Gordonia (in: high G+C Gram-positive bacteria) TaxID=2657482 RepID=UPI000FB53775|nr:TIGR00645 family protein [Gordonia sp. (in: high G+C Gram-positive bacteria)]RUP36514.1 MAG: TIGR00645 family protein [Gordonia sp. (in: high G+C Gram-positive bacteria)]HNP58324.1 TIGR00645 family protein [Gordonia sp. (in: high G+C Gram-positive bacteria)]HRC51827.1 TIGR00645 family protein [Gordonia sp. (in: high G+C Gram-positive bacteria)]
METTPVAQVSPRHPAQESFVRFIGSSIFISRWLQAPLYIGLIVAQAVYVVVFWKELIHLVSDFDHLSEEKVMLIVLGLVDVVMIANLLIMVIIGGYETFVSRIGMETHPDKPEWLSHVNPNVLKVKLAMSIIGISSIHLLKSFIEAGTTVNEPHGGDKLLWQTVIHMAFIASAMGLAFVDWLSAKAAAINHTSQHFADEV